MSRDPRAVREVAEAWEIPEADLWDSRPTFAESRAALRFAWLDFRTAVIKALTEWRYP